MGEVTRLLADAAREAGAEIRTDAEVEAIEVEGGRAVAVRLAGGETIGGRDGALQRRPEAHPARAGRTQSALDAEVRRRSGPTAARARA